MSSVVPWIRSSRRRRRARGSIRPDRCPFLSTILPMRSVLPLLPTNRRTCARTSADSMIGLNCCWLSSITPWKHRWTAGYWTLLELPGDCKLAGCIFTFTYPLFSMFYNARLVSNVYLWIWIFARAYRIRNWCRCRISRWSVCSSDRMESLLNSIFWGGKGTLITIVLEHHHLVRVLFRNAIDELRQSPSVAASRELAMNIVWIVQIIHF